MAFLLTRNQRIERIEIRISRMRERAGALLEREQATEEKLEGLRQNEEPSGRLRRTRQGRAVRRAERRLERLREKRHVMVEGELRSIMLSLEKQSQRTRERLDRELDRLAPVEAEWERLRSVFDSLEAAVAAPGLEQPANQWQGTLEIPEFPVRERDGYAKPFPEGALLF